MTDAYRTGGKNARNIYHIVDCNDLFSDVHVGCMFTEDMGRRAAVALNFFQRYGPALTDLGYTEDRRAARRAYLRLEALRQADMLGKTPACQLDGDDAHRKCIGRRSAMNQGLGCLCECHDDESPEAQQ